MVEKLCKATFVRNRSGAFGTFTQLHDGDDTQTTQDRTPGMRSKYTTILLARSACHLVGSLRCCRRGARVAHRQPEFSQLDMEMAFMDQEAIMRLAEDLVRAVFQEARLRCCIAQLGSQR